MKQRISIKDSFQIDSQYNLVRLSTRKIAPILAPILAPMYTRGCQRCNFVLQGALNCWNLKCQVAEQVV